jgi:hypothetical protein
MLARRNRRCSPPPAGRRATGTLSVRCNGVRWSALLLTAVVAAQAGCGGTPAADVPTATSQLVSPTPPSGPRHIRRPLPQWRGHAPDALGNRAAGRLGKAWVTHHEDVGRLWLAVPHHARRLLAVGGGVMEGSDDLYSPLWVGHRLIWAVSHAWDG